ncbi:MAG: hypothetical protein U0401_09745 [Anaerolineae bacterium]
MLPTSAGLGGVDEVGLGEAGVQTHDGTVVVSLIRSCRRCYFTDGGASYVRG